jgi:hypothetical protein
MSFSYDPASPTTRDKLRLLCGDTKSINNNHFLEDVDYDLHIVMESNLLLAAANCCDSIALKFADQESSYNLGVSGSVSVSKQSMSRIFQDRAKKLREEAFKEDTVLDINSFDNLVDEFGQDLSEYVGDV